MLELVAIAGLAVASFTDLRTRIVPDWLSYGLIALGLVYHAWLSLTHASITPISLALASTVLAFGFSYFLWRIGAWAGGDVKLFTALGALVPVPLVFGLPLFPFVVFICSIVLSFPFIALYVAAKTLLSKRLRKSFLGVLAASVVSGLVLAAFSTGSVFVTYLFNLPAWLSLPLVAVALLVPLPWKHGLAVLAAVPVFWFPEAALVLLPALAISLLWEFVSFGRREALRQKFPISKLTEGMIPAETLYLVKGVVKVFVPSLRQKLLLFEPRGTLVSAYCASGLEKPDIAALKKHGVKAIVIKESVPMVPALLAGLLVALWFGSKFL